MITLHHYHHHPKVSNSHNNDNLLQPQLPLTSSLNNPFSTFSYYQESSISPLLPPPTLSTSSSLSSQVSQQIQANNIRLLSLTPTLSPTLKQQDSQQKIMMISIDSGTPSICPNNNNNIENSFISSNDILNNDIITSTMSTTTGIVLNSSQQSVVTPTRRLAYQSATHSSFLLNSLSILRKRHELCDIVLIVGTNRRIYAHRVLLAAYSPYFLGNFFY